MTTKVQFNSDNTAEGEVSGEEQPLSAHDQKMVEAFDNQGGTTDQPDNKVADPDTTENKPKFADKYNSTEDLEKGYKELESERGKLLAEIQELKTGNKSDDKTPESTDEATGETDEEEQQTVPQTKIDYEKYSQSMAENDGQLTEADYSELEAMGFDKDIVDTYVDGLKAKSQAYDNAAYEAAGSQEDYEQMTRWAQENLEPREIIAFNDKVSSGNKDVMEAAVIKMTAQYRDAEGTQGKFITGNGSKGSVGGYESLAQMTADMAKPEYTADPAFRKQVEDRISRTTAF